MPTEVVHVDPRVAGLDELAFAIRALRRGKLVAFPTETVYGLGVVATEAEAVERLREVKGRPTSPFAVHLGSPEDVGRYVAKPPMRARMLIAKAWPGPLTILLPVPDGLADPELREGELFRRIAPAGVVGLRCPDDLVAKVLLSRALKPVLASSANLAAQPPPHTADDVLAQLQGRIDLLIDAGPTRFNKASTIVSFEGERLRVVREGVLDGGAVTRMARHTLLFVCSGNTCRSPMAAASARKMLADRMGVKPGQLPEIGQEVLSAGVYGGGDSFPSAQAVAAAAKLGAKVEKHRSRKLTSELINSADLIFCMTSSHLVEVQRMAPAAAGKVFLLGARDVKDPVGGDDETYLGVARQIADELAKRIKEHWS